MGDYYGVDWIANGVTLVRLWMFSNGTPHSRFWGWILGFVGVFFWALMGVMMDSLPTMITNVIYFALTLRGFLKERRNHADDASTD